MSHNTFLPITILLNLVLAKDQMKEMEISKLCCPNILVGGGGVP